MTGSPPSTARRPWLSMRKPSPHVPGERAGPAAGLGAADREIPEITAPMHRYLEQVACVLRPRSVVNTDQALRSFVRFLTEAAPRSPADTAVMDLRKRLRPSSCHTMRGYQQDRRCVE